MYRYVILNGEITNYKINKQGNIFNSNGKALATSINKLGYPCIRLLNTSKTIHRLVWVAYNGNIPDELEINHKDGNKLNSNLYNLEVVTRSENIKHAFRIGLMNNQGVNHPRASIAESVAIHIKIRLSKKESIISIAKLYGISRHIVGDIKRNKTWTHVSINDNKIPITTYPTVHYTA